MLSFAGSGRCFDFEVPKIPGPIKWAKLFAIGSSEDYEFVGTSFIDLEQARLLTFIQTDKPVYKPGQTGKESFVNTNHCMQFNTICTPGLTS